MVSKAAIVINILVVCIFIASLAASSYGVGVQEHNKAGAEYQVASAFLSISSILTIVSILSLVILVSLFSGGIVLEKTPYGGYSASMGQSGGF
jgi:hypothetical protein